MGITVNLYIIFNRIVIFIILILQIHECRKYSYLLVSSSVSFFRVFFLCVFCCCFSFYGSFTPLVRLSRKYLREGGNCEWNIFLVSFFIIFAI